MGASMLLSVSDISKSYGAQLVLNNVSFVLNAGQRAGLGGANGVGKSTLVKRIVNEVAPDSGEVLIPAGGEVGYVPQVISGLSAKTIDDLIFVSQGDLRELEERWSRLEH